MGRILSLFLILLLVWAAQAWAGPSSSASRVEMVHDPKDVSTAQGIAASAEAMLSRLEKEFGLEPRGRIRIVLPVSIEEFFQSMPGGWRPPSWAAGVAFPKLNLIVLKPGATITGGGRDRVLAHEIAHLVLGRVFQNVKLPTWLEEGLTMHLADDWDPGRQVAMMRALVNHRLIPLDRLVDRFPDERLDAETAYAQSYYFIAFLKDKLDPGVMERLIRNLGLGVDPIHALWHASGRRPRDLERAFEAWLRSRFSVFWILTSPALLWLVAAVLLAVAYLTARRRWARKRAEWEAEDDGPEDDSW